VRREADRHLRGFTLVELVIVLLILGIASVIAVPALDHAIKKREARQSVLGLAATARDLRRRAIDQGTLKRLTVEPLANSYLASDGEIIRLPENIAITGASGGEPIGQRLTQYVFFPNGSIVGGEIELTDRAGAAYVIRMEAMVGRVVVIRQ
jgi:general secretion pathway protein H